MSEYLKVKFKKFICKHFGHKLVYSHTFNNHEHYECSRCGSIISREAD